MEMTFNYLVFLKKNGEKKYKNAEHSQSSSYHGNVKEGRMISVNIQDKRTNITDWMTLHSNYTLQTIKLLCAKEANISNYEISKSFTAHSDLSTTMAVYRYCIFFPVTGIITNDHYHSDSHKKIMSATGKDILLLLLFSCLWVYCLGSSSSTSNGSSSNIDFSYPSCLYYWIFFFSIP